MELLSFLIDFVLHVDVHLKTFVLSYGAWVYALLFLIIYVETGVVVMPFLPEIRCFLWWAHFAGWG
jgi:membrane-associated protein